jgi:hypothetical protein
MSASDQYSLYEKLQGIGLNTPRTQVAVQQIIFAASKRLLHNWSQYGGAAFEPLANRIRLGAYARKSVQARIVRC